VSGEWQTKFNVSPGPGLWPLVLGPFGPDLGPDLGPRPGPELDNFKVIFSLKVNTHGLSQMPNILRGCLLILVS